jgi:hypothetical protein
MKGYIVKVPSSEAVQQTPFVFVPTPEAVYKFGRVPVNAIAYWEFRKEQYSKFHRKFFAMIKVIFDNQDQYTNPKMFYKVLIMLAGYCEIVQIEGKTLFIADSVSYEKCSQSRLEEIYDKVLDVALEKFCVGSTPKEIDKKVLEVLEFS